MRNLTLAAAVLLLTAPSAFGQDGGLVEGSLFASTLSCGSPIVVTAQFVDGSGDRTVSLVASDAQVPTVLALEIAADPAHGGAGGSGVLVPVSYTTSEPHPCPYGVSVSFGDQAIVVGLSTAKTVDPR